MKKTLIFPIVCFFTFKVYGHNSLIDQCIEATCGKNTSNIDQLNRSFQKKQNKQHFLLKKKLKDKFESLLSDAKVNYQQQIISLSDPNFYSAHNLLGVYKNLDLALNIFSWISNIIEFYPDHISAYNIREPLLKDSFYIELEKDYGSSISVLVPLIKEFEGALIKLIGLSISPSLSHYSKIYMQQNLKSGLEQMKEQIASHLESVTTQHPVFLRLAPDVYRRFKKWLDTPHLLTLHEKKKAYNHYLIFDAFLKAQHSPHFAEVTDHCDINSIHQLYIEKTGLMAKTQLLDEKSLMERENSLRSSFDAFLDATFGHALSLKDIESFKIDFEAYKKDMVANILPQLKLDNEKEIIAELKNIKAIPPFSDIEFYSSIKEALEDEIEDSLIRTPNENTDDQLALKMLKQRYHMMFPHADQLQPYANLQDIIDEYSKTSLDDCSYTQSKYILMSWHSYRSDYGRSIIMHELGHQLEELIESHGSNEDRGWLESLRMKLSQQHPKSIAGQVYTSEDFADYISGLDTKSENLGCFLTKSEEDINAASTINKDPNDPHSSNFFRMLHIEHIKHGSIPQTCSELIINNELEMPLFYQYH